MDAGNLMLFFNISKIKAKDYALFLLQNPSTAMKNCGLSVINLYSTLLRYSSNSSKWEHLKILMPRTTTTTTPRMKDYLTAHTVILQRISMLKCSQAQVRQELR